MTTMKPEELAGRDFNAAELDAISLMSRASRTLSDEMWSVGAVQELAYLYARIAPILSDEDRAIMIGAGAYIMYMGKAEVTAGIQAHLALLKARSPHA